MQRLALHGHEQSKGYCLPVYIQLAPQVPIATPSSANLFRLWRHIDSWNPGSFVQRVFQYSTPWPPYYCFLVALSSSCAGTPGVTYLSHFAA